MESVGQMCRGRFAVIGDKPGRPRLNLTTLYAAAGYDSEGTRDILSIFGITPFIRRLALAAISFRILNNTA